MLNRDAAMPAALLTLVPSIDAVKEHRAAGLSGSRWGAATRDAGLPAPVDVMSTDGVFSLSRGEILDFATSEINGDNALQLLYRSLAWGLGSKGFRMAAKMRGIGETNLSTLQGLLVEAWTAVREGMSPHDCYEVLLTPKGRPKVKQLGAAFATKYLYFAAGDHAPSTPILDAVVARALRPLAWDNAPSTAWWSSTYADYCHLMANWAQQAEDHSGVPVRVDQIEMLLFTLQPRTETARRTSPPA